MCFAKAASTCSFAAVAMGFVRVLARSARSMCSSVPACTLATLWKCERYDGWASFCVVVRHIGRACDRERGAVGVVVAVVAVVVVVSLVMRRG